MFNPQYVASQLLQKQFGGNQILGSMQAMQNQGMSSDMIIDTLMQKHPQLRGNQMLAACKGKSPQEITQYAEKVSKHMGVI